MSTSSISGHHSHGCLGKQGARGQSSTPGSPSSQDKHPGMEAARHPWVSIRNFPYSQLTLFLGKTLPLLAYPANLLWLNTALTPLCPMVPSTNSECEHGSLAASCLSSCPFMDAMPDTAEGVEGRCPVHIIWGAPSKEGCAQKAHGQHLRASPCPECLQQGKSMKSSRGHGM